MGRAAFVLLLLAGVACSSSSNSTPSTPLGPDAGAGCSSAITGHCDYPDGLSSVLRPACTEFSGTNETTTCATPLGQYSAGPCSRSTYDASCSFASGQAEGSTCLGFETIWWSTSSWPADAGVIGYPKCLSQ